jgi:hypothetical protein
MPYVIELNTILFASTIFQFIWHRVCDREAINELELETNSLWRSDDCIKTLIA